MGTFDFCFFIYMYMYMYTVAGLCKDRYVSYRYM